MHEPATTILAEGQLTPEVPRWRNRARFFGYLSPGLHGAVGQTLHLASTSDTDRKRLTPLDSGSVRTPVTTLGDVA